MDPQLSEPAEDSYKFSCPYCLNHIEATTEWIGQKIDCPHCSDPFVIPPPGEAAESLITEGPATPPPSPASAPYAESLPNIDTDTDPRTASAYSIANENADADLETAPTEPQRALIIPDASSSLGSHHPAHHPRAFYGGLSRLGYWLASIFVVVIAGAFYLMVSVALKNQTITPDDALVWWSGVALASTAVQMILSYKRLENIGHNPAATFFYLVPIAGLFIHIRCLLYQEGFDETRKLDDAGKVLGILMFAPPLIVGGLVVLLEFLLAPGTSSEPGDQSPPPAASEAADEPQAHASPGAWPLFLPWNSPFPIA